MTFQTRKYTSHITFSGLNCCAIVYTTEETFSVEDGIIKIHNSSTKATEYLRPGKTLTTDEEGNVHEVEIPDQDISGEDEFTQKMIRSYWDNYKGDLMYEKEN
jgi:hypothetical protein